MGELAERACFHLCRMAGAVLRSGRYARVRVVLRDGEARVEKRRQPHAPLLVGLGEPLVRFLDTGVRVLPQHEWEQREHRLYHSLYGSSVTIDADGTLVLPRLAGRTLAAVLEDGVQSAAARRRAIVLAATALARLHTQGITHGDAMAENVMIDVDAGAARWFDFETVHDPRRPVSWRRADDVRTLLATCVLRVAGEDVAGTVQIVLDTYADEDVLRMLPASFGPVRRAFAFHLGQAPLSFDRFREVQRLLRQRAGNHERTTKNHRER